MTFSFQDILHAKESYDPDFNIPLIIGLSAGLGVLFLILMLLTIYFSFFNNNSSIFLGSNFNIPGEFDDEQGVLNDEREQLPKLSQEERDLYFQAKEYQLTFPPITKALGSTLTESERDYILERGIQAYMLESPLEGDALVEDKLSVRFTSNETVSCCLNYPLPILENETVYFETKVYEMDPNCQLSIGLSTKPYPSFRLPGYNKYSIAYESSGCIRINQPFYSPTIWNKLIEGDVIGCGFKPRSGTIFFTHNGKKLLEAAHNVKFDLFPILGSKGCCKLDINIGQLGFVFIEANVKRWGFGSVYGTIGVPPAYGKEINNDTVLDKGEELPPNYPSEEETFFGPSALLRNNNSNKPPSYNDDDNDNDDNENNDEGLYERRSSTFDQVNNHIESEPLPQSSSQLNSSKSKKNKRKKKNSKKKRK